MRSYDLNLYTCNQSTCLPSLWNSCEVSNNVRQCKLGMMSGGRGSQENSALDHLEACLQLRWWLVIWCRILNQQSKNLSFKSLKFLCRVQHVGYAIINQNPWKFKVLAQSMELRLRNCRGGRFTVHWIFNFKVRQAAGKKMEKTKGASALPKWQMLTLGPGGVRSGCCREVVYLTVVVQIFANRVTVMLNSASSQVVFFWVIAQAMALRADLST